MAMLFALVVLLAGVFGTARPAAAQDWFKTGTGLGVSKTNLAVPDLAARSTAAQPLEKTFHDVLWSDLEYSGILDLVSPSFYPTQSPSQPNELKAGDWANAPVSANMIAYGSVTTDGAGLAAAGFLSDVRNAAADQLTQGPCAQFPEQRKPAIPLFVKLLNDPDESVRMNATNELKEIDPEAAAKAGIK